MKEEADCSKSESCKMRKIQRKETIGKMKEGKERERESYGGGKKRWIIYFLPTYTMGGHKVRVGQVLG